MSVIAFTVWVSGKLFDPRINDGPCTCNADSKYNYLCVITTDEHRKENVILVSDMFKRPAFSRVNVICHREAE